MGKYLFDYTRTGELVNANLKNGRCMKSTNLENRTFAWEGPVDSWTFLKAAVAKH